MVTMDRTGQPKNQNHRRTYNVREESGDNGQTQSAKESNHYARAESKHWTNRPAGAQGPPPERDPATGSNRPAGAQGPLTQSAKEPNHNAGAGSRLWIEDRTRRSPGPPPERDPATGSNRPAGALGPPSPAGDPESRTISAQGLSTPAAPHLGARA